MNEENEKETIILTGLSAQFQSSIGRLLAGQLNWPFFDLNEEVANLLRRLSPQELVAISENQKNSLKQQVLVNLIAKKEVVIATSSDIVADPQDFQLLKHCEAVIIYLHSRFDFAAAASVATQLVTNRDLSSFITNMFHLIWELYDERYRQISDLMIEVNGKKAAKLAKEIATFISLEVGEDDFF